tara:strand:+ start:774 stop:3218 length:2445 start_codon:yes stop_codon:yes gene_type:complete
MTTLNFPAAPSAGATHNGANGLQYTYDGVKWTSQGAYATGLTQPLKLDNISSQFNGSLTTFNLTVSSAGVNIYKAESVTISLGGVIQEPTTAYTINTAAGTITFATAPVAGTTFFGLLSSTIQSTVVADGAISTAKIVADAVNGTKIADDSINSEHYVDGSIDTAHIADSQITSAKLADDAVTTAKLADDSVTIHQIADNAVGSNQIVAQAIFNSDINNSAAIAQSKLNIADATTSASGYMSGSDKTKLDGIESNATADQTASEIRTLVESATDSNVFTDADHTKLNAIEASATADQTAAEIRTLVESATDSNVFTDADHTKLNNINVTNDKLSVDSNNKFTVTGTSGQYPTITIDHSANTVEGEVIRFERTDANNARFHSLKVKSHSGNTDENYISFHLHDRDTINSQVEQLKITPNSILLNYDGTTKAQTSANGLDLPDNSKLQLGTSQDLKIYHDGTHSYLQKGDGTGNLYVDANGIILRGANGETLTSFTENGAVELYHDNVKRCETSTDGLNLPDNSKLQLGDSQDLQIFHNGTNSLIKDSGTGFLLLDTNTLMVRKVDGSETMAKFTANGAAELYYDNVKRAETSADGFDAIESLRIPNDTGRIKLGASQDFLLYHGGTNSIINNFTGDLKIQTSSTDIIRLYQSDKSVGFFYAGAKKIETTAYGVLVTGTIVTTTGNLRCQSDSYKITAGAGNDLTAFHNGTDSFIENTNGNLHIRPKSSEEGIKLIPDGSVEIYHDNVKKLETTSSGITVTGSVTTQDMNMSNLNGTANEVDNTKGSWSIQEGADDLFLINRVSGKKYKFNLTEIN